MIRAACLLALFVVALGQAPAWAQLEGQALIDSVRPALAKARAEGNDSLAVVNLRYLNYAYQNIAPDSSIHYGQQALALAEKKGMRYSAFRSKMFLGMAYLEKGRFEMGMRHMLDAHKMADRYGPNAVMSASNHIGNAYYTMGQYERARPYFREYRRYAEELKDTAKLANSYILIGNTFRKGQQDSSLWYTERSIHLYRRSNNLTPGYYYALGDLGILYSEMGQQEKARKCLFEVLEFGQRNGDMYVTGAGHMGLANTYLQQAKGLPEQKSRLAGASTVEGSTRDTLKDRRYLLGQAVRYSSAAVQIGEASGMVRLLPDALSILSEAHKLQGNYQAALETSDRGQAIKDSMYSEKSRQKIDSLTQRQEQDVKQKQIEIQQLQIQKAEQRQWFLLAGLGLALVAVGFVVRSRQAIAKERRRSDKLLLNILPAETAAELKETGKSQARHHEQASVLFADFVAFSPLASKLPARDLVQILDVYFQAFDDICRQQGVEKIKTIGDAYMAVSGVPAAQKDHAERLIMAGQKMLEFVAGQKEVRQQEGLPFFQLRVGIHSGPLTSGVVGKHKFAFDVWGDTVNLAARLEAHGEPGKLNISEATYALVKDRFPCTPRGPVTVKHGQQVEMYFVEEPVLVG